MWQLEVCQKTDRIFCEMSPAMHEGESERRGGGGSSFSIDDYLSIYTVLGTGASKSEETVYPYSVYLLRHT